jgi:cytochrome c-type biogenesis protein CcmH/NrfF
VWRKQAVMFVFVGSTAIGSAAGQAPDEVGSVTSQLVCTCGCGNMIVANCSCSEADRVREDVSGLLTSGLSRDEILEQYARIYGTECGGSVFPHGSYHSWYWWALPGF